MGNEQLRHIHPAEVGFTWARLRRQTAGEMAESSRQARKPTDLSELGGRGRTRLIHLGLRGAAVLVGLTLGVILYPLVKSSIDEMIAKDNEFFRQTNQDPQLLDFKSYSLKFPSV